MTDLWILWVVFAEKPQKTQLLLLGTPRGLKPCCMWSMQSCEPTKVCLIFCFIFIFRFFSFYRVFLWGHNKSEVWECDLRLVCIIFSPLYSLFFAIYATAHDIYVNNVQIFGSKQSKDTDTRMRDVQKNSGA